MSDLGMYEENENLQFSDTVKNSLLQTVKWTNFLAILGFIAIGLLILCGIAMALGVSAMSTAFSGSRGFGAIPGILIAIYMIIICALYFYPLSQLYQFSQKIKSGILSSSQTLTEQAFEHQRKMFKFMGILTIIVLGLYAISILAMMLGMAIGR